MSLPVKEKNSKIISIRHLSFNEIIKSFGRKNDAFYVIDSTEIKYSLSLLCPFKTNDFSILYIDKGELKIRLDLTTHTLSEGSLFIKSPNAIFQVQSFSTDCHFRIFGFTPEFISASRLHKKHLEALAFLSSHNNPHLPLNTIDGATLLQFLNLLHQKSNLKEKPL